MKENKNTFRALELASLPLTLTLNLLLPILLAYYLAQRHHFPLLPAILLGTFTGIAITVHYFITRAKKFLK